MKLKYMFLFIFIFYINVLRAENISPQIQDGIEITKKYIQLYSKKALQLWENCQKTGEDSYHNDPLHNCSVNGHPNALIFKNFINRYARGIILDIGCGPQPIPLYLADYPVSQIVGMDPIGNQKDHPFLFYKGLAEYLPWENETFDTIVIGTSLDHVILLDKVILELHRVLKSDGRLIVWSGFVENTNRYNPYVKNLTTFDKYHLFHFTRYLFEEIFRERFDIMAKKDISKNESFYIFIPQKIKREKFLSPDDIKKMIM